MAVTHEGTSPTEKWVDAKGAEYPYAYDKGGKLQRWFGVSGIPHAALVDPSGTIVWRGHPASLKDDIIEQHLAGTLAKPTWEWPAAAKGVRAALAKRQYAKALAAAEKLDAKDGGEEIVDVLRKLVQGKMQALVAAKEAGDYLRAQELATELKSQLAGLPEADEAADILAVLKGDREVQTIVKAQKSVMKIRAEFVELDKKKEADKLIEKLKKLSEKHTGTIVYTQAKEAIEVLNKLRVNLR